MVLYLMLEFSRPWLNGMQTPYAILELQSLWRGSDLCIHYELPRPLLIYRLKQLVVFVVSWSSFVPPSSVARVDSPFLPISVGLCTLVGMQRRTVCNSDISALVLRIFLLFVFSYGSVVCSSLSIVFYSFDFLELCYCSLCLLTLVG